MLIALSGTPGTGKSTTAAILESEGNSVVDVNELADNGGCMRSMDEQRESREVDTACLERIDLSEYRAGTVFDGHLAHYLPVDTVILLRTSPAVLEGRLLTRGWPQEKVRENMEAEACDVILIESTELGRTVYEIDTTSKSPQSVVRDIGRISSGDTADYLPGKIDWSQEVLSWY